MPLSCLPVFFQAYLRHLFAAGEMLAMRLAVLHNLYFYNALMDRIRLALEEGTLKLSIGNTEKN